MNGDGTTPAPGFAAVAARAYIERGIAPVPIYPRGKQPSRDGRTDLTGWQRLRPTAQDVPALFLHPEANVGGLLGEPSGGLVDVDLDVPEAAAVAPYILPTTARAGRESAPGSHYFYVAHGLETKKYQRPFKAPEGRRKTETIVEVRGTGTQTVLPPSVHPTGELYRWEHDAVPVEVDADALHRLVALVAVAALLLRLWPRGKGARHDACMALVGCLYLAGYADDEAGLVVRALANASGDDEIEDRLATVAATYARAAGGGRYTRAKALRALLVDSDEDGRTFSKALDWLGYPAGDEGPSLLDARADGAPTSRSERRCAERNGEDTAPGVPADGEADAAAGADDAGEEPAPRRSQATHIVEIIAAEAELWRNQDGKAFISFDGEGARRETHSLRAPGARSWIARRYYLETGRAPGAQGLQDALAVLEGIAVWEGIEHRTAVRVAEIDLAGSPVLYLDLGTETWEVVEVRAGHWEIIPAAACPVRFERRGGMLPLPTPERGGDARALGDLLNLDPDGSDLVLLLTWVLLTLREVGGYPVLEVTGEQGSGKSTTVRFLRSLTDPNQAPLRSLPRTEQDAHIAASNSRVLAFDNVSGVSRDMADRICKMATGAGFSTRTLYTDAGETIFVAARPQMINGIEDIATFADLADRTVTIRLPRIDEGERRTDAELVAAFTAAHPRILGGLLDAAAGGLLRLPGVNVERLPRMADYGLFATACEVPLGFAEGAFFAAFEEGRAALVEATVEGEPIAEALGKLLALAPFEGPSTDLLKALSDAMGYGDGPNEKRAPREWPKDARRLSGKLRRLAPALRALGYSVEFERKGKDRTRTWVIQNAPVNHRPPRPQRPPATETGLHAHENGTQGGGRCRNGSTVPASAAASAGNGHYDADAANADGADAADGESAPYSAWGDGLPGAAFAAPALRRGARVRTPDGEGAVLQAFAGQVTVHLDGAPTTTDFDPRHVEVIPPF